jgi:hypothetical protein
VDFSRRAEQVAKQTRPRVLRGRAKRAEGRPLDFRYSAERLDGPKENGRRKQCLFIFRKYFHEKNNLEIAK